MKTIGEKIFDYRKAKGMSQEELGQHLGVGRAAINKYETGRVTNIPLEKLLLLADALEVDPAKLLGDDAGLLEYTAVDNKQYAAYNALILSRQHAKNEPATVFDDEEHLLELYRELNDEGREKLIEHADDMVQSRKYIKI